MNLEAEAAQFFKIDRVHYRDLAHGRSSGGSADWRQDIPRAELRRGGLRRRLIIKRCQASLASVSFTCGFQTEHDDYDLAFTPEPEWVPTPR